jgi:mannose-6-phosphate isomerase-like protein (cupin superfamily)
MPGYLVHQDDVAASAAAGDTASERVTIDAASGCQHLEARVLTFAPGRSQPRRLEGREGAFYVAAGEGTLHLDGDAHALAPDTGVYLEPGEQFWVENPGAAELVLVGVDAPLQIADRARGERQVTVRLADQPPLPASGGRIFRYVVTPETGCRDFTQFVGEIPPGRAGDHSHTYDEIVFVLQGEGVLHLEGHEDAPLRAGSCMHLPPLQVHCLENTGDGVMRVLGVFHPAGDPASRAYEDTVSSGGGGER